LKIIFTSLQTGNHASILSFKISAGWMLFLMPNQECQSTEGKKQIKQQEKKM